MWQQEPEASSSTYRPRLLVEGGRLGLSLTSKQQDSTAASLTLARLEAVEHLSSTSARVTSAALTEVRHQNCRENLAFASPLAILVHGLSTACLEDSIAGCIKQCMCSCIVQSYIVHQVIVEGVTSASRLGSVIIPEFMYELGRSNNGMKPGWQ